MSQIISILITHNLVDYKLNTKQIVEYKMNIRNTINTLKYPKYIGYIKETLKDDYSWLIVKEILLHGYLEMSSVILKLLAKSFNENKLFNKDANQINLIFNSIKSSFTSLAENNYVERIPELDTDQNMSNGAKNEDHTNKQKVPKFSFNNMYRFDTPHLNIEG